MPSRTDEEYAVRPLLLVFTRHAMVLSKRRYRTSQEVEDDFDDYISSLGPYSVDELFEYLTNDYTASTIPFVRDEVERFVADPTAEHLEEGGGGGQARPA